MLKKIAVSAFSLLLLSVVSTRSAQSQENPKANVSADQVNEQTIQLMRQDIRSERKKIVAANLPLTAEEATKFWPVYDSYVADTVKLNDTRYALIKEYSQSYSTMTDAQADSFIKRWITTDRSVSELRLKWVPEFEKVISPKKTAAFFQIDRRTGMMVDIQLASRIPLVQP